MKNQLGFPLDITQRIDIGDRVRVQFDRDKADLIGDVIYMPEQCGDIWIIVSTGNRLNYVNYYTVISKIIT